MNKWDKLRILLQWLEQGRILEFDGVKYGMSESGNVLHMITEERGVELKYLSNYWSLIEKMPDDKFYTMGGELVLTKMNSKSYTS